MLILCQIFNGINGLLLPGGSAPLTGPGGYAAVGQLFYNWAREANDRGDTFPIWGTCNGFELLTVLSSGDRSRLTNCDSQDEAVPLIFYPGGEDSYLFRPVRLDFDYIIFSKGPKKGDLCFRLGFFRGASNNCSEQRPDQSSECLMIQTQIPLFGFSNIYLVTRRHLT